VCVVYPTQNLNQFVVVLVAPRNPLNIGAVARAMSNFGAQKLRVVNAYDVAFREAKSAVGASDVLTRAEEFRSLADAVADCRLVVGTTSVGHRNLNHPLRTLEEAGRIIRRRLSAGQVALLFGSEKVGLTTEQMTHCHWLLRIPTREQHSSMNLAQAVAVCLYEMVRSKTISRHKAEEDGIRAGDAERFTQLLLHALAVSGYTKPASAEATDQKLRRMVRRLQLSSKDGEIWLGMLRQIVWKIDRQR